MSYTFFENYHQAAKDYANGDMGIYGRLLYIINSYAIDGETLPDLSPVEKLFFTSVKASLDKSREMRAKGQKGGRPQKTENTDLGLNHGFNHGFKGGFNEVEVEVEVEKEVELKEVEVEVERENNPTTTLQKNKIKASQILEDFSKAHGLNFEKKTISELLEKLSKLEDPRVNLENQLDFVKAKYPDKTGEELNRLFIASLSWKEKPKPKTKKNEPKIKPQAPKVCTFCGSKLELVGVPDVVLCPTCSPRTFWELVGHDWECNRK